MYSTVEDGKVLDWHFKKAKGTDFIFNFYIGEKFVGQIFNLGHRKWSAISPHPQPGELHHVYGFARRGDAAEFLLKVRRYERGKRIDLE